MLLNLRINRNVQGVNEPSLIRSLTFKNVVHLNCSLFLSLPLPFPPPRLSRAFFFNVGVSLRPLPSVKVLGAPALAESSCIDTIHLNKRVILIKHNPKQRI